MILMISCIIRQPVQCVDNELKDSLTKTIHHHLIGREIAPLFDNVESIRHSIYLFYSILTTCDVCVDKQLLGQINVEMLTTIIKQNDDSELLEVTLYLLYSLANRDKFTIEGFALSEESRDKLYSDEVKSSLMNLINSPPMPTLGLAALLLANEIQLNVEVPVLLPGALKCLADLTVIAHRPPVGLLDGLVGLLASQVRSCSLIHIITIGKPLSLIRKKIKKY